MTKEMTPYNIEAESSVLGSILISSLEVMDEITSVISADDFYRTAHKDIYNSMIELYKKNINIDSVTLIEQLQKNNKLEKVGGIAYITNLCNYVPSAKNCINYAKIVKEKSIQRKLFNAGNMITSLATESKDINQTLAEAEKIMIDISKDSSGDDSIQEPIDRMLDTFKALEERYNNREEGKCLGIDTGYKDLNKILGGFQKSDFIIIGGRPAMGKTAFALNLATKISAKFNKPVAIFSLEMSKQQLDERLLGALACVDLQKIREGNLTDKEWEKLTQKFSILSNAPLYVNDEPYLTPQILKRRARRLKREKGIELIVIDYLQLMAGDRRTENKQQEVSEISRQLKLLARELDIPIIALSQLSRGLEARQDKRPIMSDIRESGAIEQDADLVMFLYRDEYYNENTQDKNIAEVIISKHRKGATGTVKLFYKKEFCAFADLEKNR
jgi:replicative DNA helicase